jgi:hypothetical protein
MSEIIKFAGDIAVEKINLLSYDLTTYSIKNQLLAIQIFEDLFSPFISGVLTFKDSLDFMNALPVIGQEVLDLDIYTPTLKSKGGRIKGQFYISELKNREYIGDRSVVYEIAFISKEAIVDMNIKLSKPYQGKVSDVAKQILSEDLVKFDKVKKLNIEPTKNAVKYVSNYWSPIRNMNYLCDYALNENGSPSYIFFENRDGFNFGSLETLCASPVVTQEFKYDSSTQEVLKIGGSTRDINRDYQRITQFSLKNGFNLVKRLNSGMVASAAFGFDITTKRFQIKPFEYFSTFKDRKHLNEHPIINNRIPQYYTAKLLYAPNPYENFTDYGNNTNFSFIQKRISEIAQGSDFRIEINVPGRLDYTVGQVVRITSFQVEPIVKSESNKSQLDMIFSGKYLVSAINHYITREQHQCSIELVKDSYISSFTK